MKLLIALAITFSLGCASCRELPEKPVITLCVIDVPAQICRCGETDPETFFLESQIKATPLEALKASVRGPMRREPLLSCDKSVAFRPPEWVKVRNYIDALEREITGGK